MGTKARPAQLRPPAEVRQWRAERARRAAQAASERTQAGRRYSWPADRQAILAETMAAARSRPGAMPAPAGENQ